MPSPIADPIEVREADPGLLPEVAALHAKNYGGTPEARLLGFRDRFLHPFARDRSFVVVACAGRTVVGTQTYTYWPYAREERIHYCVQSGLTLVDEAFRGRGLFSRMLACGHEVALARGVEFMVGFPLAASYGGFMKAGWIHAGSLRWYLRPLHPMRVIRRRSPAEDAESFEFSAEHRLDSEPEWDAGFERVGSSGLLHMPIGADTWAYRYGGAPHGRLFFRDSAQRTDVIAVCRPRRSKGFSELIVGEVLSRKGVPRGAVGKALAALVSDAKKHGSIDAVTLLSGRSSGPLRRALWRRLFLWTPESVPFIVKPMRAQAADEDVTMFRSWNLLFADVDTW